MTQEELEDAKATLTRSPLEFAEIWGEKLIEYHDMAYADVLLSEVDNVLLRQKYGRAMSSISVCSGSCGNSIRDLMVEYFKSLKDDAVDHEE